MVEQSTALGFRVRGLGTVVEEVLQPLLLEPVAKLLEVVKLGLHRPLHMGLGLGRVLGLYRVYLLVRDPGTKTAPGTAGRRQTGPWRRGPPSSGAPVARTGAMRERGGAPPCTRAGRGQARLAPRRSHLAPASRSPATARRGRRQDEERRGAPGRCAATRASARIDPGSRARSAIATPPPHAS